MMVWKLPTLQQLRSNRFLLVWNLASILTFVVPLLSFTIARGNGNNNYDDEEEQNGNNDYDGDDNGDQNQQQQSHWWQFWKSSTTYDEDEDQRSNSQDSGSPWWWVWSSEEGEPEEEGQGTLLFVYLWTLLLLGAITFFGNNVITNGERNQQKDLVWVLLGYLNTGFLSSVLVAGLGVVEVGGREVEETGWYGQTSVLVFLTSMMGVIHSAIFLLWIYRSGVTYCDNGSAGNDFAYQLNKENSSKSAVHDAVAV
mmetsp:Transcript_20412/g.56798  ORF Transcript_20412/g.56798 Transcript_20412/m.56798 type:complete len:254 (-) Transcript_20412:1016-1777(-)|eukprot:CAMPEP_0198113894 /NCGR_PEP_ID=MMETSP1442-20131203/5445_1 /TAXON_ID= /ORGANISM="Craspedostauros australis, Strain CCMP3328" /LENGTH=253 /DNA_ID=CAMNT_0043771093 /DNA_START=246 /DNA_END=1007 /DNA_ORIENTATION=-